MLPVSAISHAATQLRDLLAARIDDLQNTTQIRIGHPKDTLQEMAAQKDKNQLNLFFYNVGYDGYPADGVSENPFYVRLYCLITAVGGTTQSGPSPGENDLRLIGEVMRVLHEQPVVSIKGADNRVVSQLQIVPHALSLDNLNHIWSTQGDTAYRLSVAYEMALAPIPLRAADEISPRVADPQWVIWGDMTREDKRARDGISSHKPRVDYLEIDTDSEDWMPHICLVEHLDADHKQLHYVYHVQGDLSSKLDILIAGKNNGAVKFFWNVWRRKKDNSVVAWKADIPDSVSPEEREIKDTPGSSEPFIPNRIDPDNIDSRRIFEVQLPDEVKNDTKTWQALLHAVRPWEHEEPAGSGSMVTTMIKSNSVLLYGDGP